MLVTFDCDRIAGHRSTTAAGVRFFLALAAALMLAAALQVKPAQANPRFAAVVVDAATGKIVFSRYADSYRYPASLTKMMTLYLLFEDLKAGRVSLSTELKVSQHSSSRPPSKIGFKAGQTITVRDAIGVLVTKSANDVACAVAENLNGSVSAFAARMTRTARSLGMSRTTFRNPSGLPDAAQKTTARDMATLGLRLQRDFPEYFKYFAMRTYSYKGRNYRNHNRLLGRLKGIDGIKTGYTRASGFNLVSSVERGGRRVVGVVMGGRTSGSRNRYMVSMIDRVFSQTRLSRGDSIAIAAGDPPGIDLDDLKSGDDKAPVTPRNKPQIGKDSGAWIKPAKTAGGDAFKSVEAPDATTQNAENAENAENTDSAADTGTIATASEIPGSDSWNIQIGAFPTRQGAEKRIEAAMAKAGPMLNGKRAFTMQVEQNSGTLYRARISGFDRNSAKQTCRVLSRKGMGCFALAPRT